MKKTALSLAGAALAGLIIGAIGAGIDADASLITHLTSGHIWVGNSSNVQTDVACSGDVTCANTGAITIANGAVSNLKLANPSTTVNGQTCTLGSTCTVTAAATAITVGSTTISAGTTGKFLYDNAGTLGEIGLTSAHLFVGNGSNIPVDVAVSGDVSLANTGAFTVAKVNGVAYGSGPSTNTVPVVTGSNTVTYEAVPNAALANAATTVNGQTCTLGSTCTITAAATAITVGSTTVSGGTSGRLLYDNAGTLGEPTMTASSGALTLGSTTGPVAGSVTMWGSSSGSLQILPAAAAGTGSVLTLPGGTTDFSATGGTDKFVKQNSAGAAFTVVTIACANLSNSGTACTAATGTSGTTLPFLDGTNTFSGVQAFGEVHGTTETVTLTSNNYNAVVADCGKTKLLPTGTTPTVTLPNINPASGSCTITFVTTAAKAYLFNAASGGSKQNSQGFYTSRGTAAGDTISVILITPSVSAALWSIAGDVTS